MSDNGYKVYASEQYVDEKLSGLSSEIVPIEQLVEYGTTVETKIIGQNHTCRITFNSSMKNPQDKIFAVKLNQSENFKMNGMSFSFKSTNGENNLVTSSIGDPVNSYYCIAKQCNTFIIYEIISGLAVSFEFDTDGNFVSDSIKKIYNITTDNLIAQLNSSLNSTSYEPSNDTDVATKAYVDNNSATQPDWNQNDSSAKDYILNKPFYMRKLSEYKPQFDTPMVETLTEGIVLVKDLSTAENDYIEAYYGYKNQLVSPAGETYLRSTSLYSTMNITMTQVANVNNITKIDNVNYYFEANRMLKWYIISDLSALNKENVDVFTTKGIYLEASDISKIHHAKLDVMMPAKITSEYLPYNVMYTPASAEVGQTLTVKEVDNMGRPIIWECTEQLQPDWNQNDETASDYIKNKPFGGEHNVYYEWDGNTDGLTTYSYEIEGDTASLYKVSNNVLNREDLIGTTFTIIANGETIPFEFDINGIITDENYENVFSLKFEDNAPESFIFVENGNIQFNDSISLDAGVWFITVNNVINCYISKIEKNTLKQLDEKYIPDTIARKSDIPETFETVQPDWNQNDETASDYIKNKPFYDSRVYTEVQETIELTFDGNIEGKEYINVSDNEYFVKISDTPMLMDEELNADVTLVNGDFDHTNIEVITSDSIELVSENLYYISTWVSDGNDTSIIVATDDTSFNNLSFTKGIWVICKPNNNIYVSDISYIITKTEVDGLIKQIDDEFIPDTIARKEDVDTAITNLVGLAPEARNTIEELATAIAEHEDVTTALDSAITNKANASDLTAHTENTDIHVTAEEKVKWNSTPEFTELILKSSTEGSDKKFKITIDDDGNLKVEEIIPPEVVLIDFTYTKNEDGTYTITDWKGTLNGEASTECIIPDHDLIKVNW